jgi:hypothetical protein
LLALNHKAVEEERISAECRLAGIDRIGNAIDGGSY